MCCGAGKEQLNWASYGETDGVRSAKHKGVSGGFLRVGTESRGVQCSGRQQAAGGLPCVGPAGTGIATCGHTALALVPAPVVSWGPRCARPAPVLQPWHRCTMGWGKKPRWRWEEGARGVAGNAGRWGQSLVAAQDPRRLR